GLLKNLRIRQKTYFRSSSVRIADNGKRIHDLSSLISLPVNLSLVADIHLQPYGQCIDNRSAHTVQTAGYLVSAAAELTACVKNGEDNLYSGNPFFLVDAHRDPSSVIPHSDGVIFIYKYLNGIAVARECFID